MVRRCTGRAKGCRPGRRHCPRPGLHDRHPESSRDHSTRPLDRRRTTLESIVSLFISYRVTCNGPYLDDPEDECEAEFDIEVGPPPDPADLNTLIARQMEQRGWRIEAERHICPLHRNDSAAL